MLTATQKRTAEAIDFQIAHNLPATGSADLSLIAARLA